MNSIAQRNDEFVPSANDSLNAARALRQLSSFAKQDGSEEVLSIENIAMPAGAVRLLMEVLSQAAQGHSVTLVPSTKMLTTQEAADLLNVSRPFVVKLLEKGEIPFERVGTHRRILASALFSYKRASAGKREEAFDELARIAQEDGLGYE